MRKKGIFHKVLVGAFVAVLGVQGILFAPHVQAVDFNDIVSVRTIDRDIMVGTTENSLFSSEEISGKMNLDCSLAGQSYKMTTTNIDATDLSNWYVYDHYDTAAYADETVWASETGYNKNLRPYFAFSENSGFVAESQALDVDEALEKSEEGNGSSGNVYFLKEHISASSENGNASMKFYGYGTAGYSDFLFYPAQETGTKKVEYTIDAKNVKTHSLSQAGFLFNCGITLGKMDGYVMLLTFKDGILTDGNSIQNVTASGIKSVAIYKVANLSVENVHQYSTYLNPNSTGQLYLTELTKTDLSSIAFEDHFDISNVKMEITNNTLKVEMTEAGSQAGDNPETITIADIQNFDSSSETY